MSLDGLPRCDCDTCGKPCRLRHEYRVKAEAHVKAGNVVAAVECYQRAVDVTPKMAKQVIEVS